MGDFHDVPSEADEGKANLSSISTALDDPGTYQHLKE